MTEITFQPFEGNRENLQKLIDGAKMYATRFPDQFDMTSFNSNDADPDTAAEKIHNCGTSACFAGIGPVVPGLEAKPDHDYWSLYIEDTFSITSDDDYNTWMWLFGAEWGEANRPTGTIWHAIGRAEYALEVGIPSNWEAQVDGDAEPTYLAYVKEPA